MHECTAPILLFHKIACCWLCNTGSLQEWDWLTIGWCCFRDVIARVVEAEAGSSGSG